MNSMITSLTKLSDHSETLLILPPVGAQRAAAYCIIKSVFVLNHIDFGHG